jgi:ribose transport system substrate-binding protein
MDMKQARWLAVALAGALLLGACGEAAGPDTAAGEEKVLALVTPYYASATTKEVLDKVQAEAEALGWRADITDTAGDFDRLNSAIQDAVTQQVDAIVLGMGDPDQMTRGLDAASGAGIPVFGIDAAPAPGVAVNVTSDNTDLGRQSAQWLVDEIGGSGAVLMFTHDPHPGVRARAESAAAVFDEAGIEIVQRIHVEVPGPVDNARRAMQDFLTANPGDAIAGVWAGWDEPALGATQAMEAADREGISVVGVDGTDFALAEIEKDGPFGATVKQDWDAIASRTVELIRAYFDGDEPQVEQEELPGQLITRADV